MTATLLVELLTEELPPKALWSLGQAFAKSIYGGLVLGRFLEEGPIYDPQKLFATPRRLAVQIPEVLSIAGDLAKEVDGPLVIAKPEAVAGFARKQGLEVRALQQRDGPKGKIFVAKITIKGTTLDSALEGIVSDAIKKLPVPKVMRWGSGDAQFVRPVHGLVMLHGKQVVSGKVLGLVSGNRTLGHRFMSTSEITLVDADAYESQMRDEGMVIADFATRRGEIERQLQSEAKRQNANLAYHRDFLDEVTALVEHSTVYVGEFDKAFLAMPQECLILTMRQNQKYFPLFDDTTRLLPKFLIVSNMKAGDPRNIIGGNQRVVRPRLEDARFFYNQDRKQRLEERIPLLAKMVYHNKLGSQLDRVQRVKLLAGKIARLLGADALQAERAAELAKADLLTGMVGEFPELQGVMGRYYALHDKEPAAVADAIEAHYRPRFAGDQLPEGALACSVALADKLEILVGIFGIKQIPTGDRDPFALRRHALGVLRILSERQIKLDLHTLLQIAHDGFPKGMLVEAHEPGGVTIPSHIEVEFFIMDRAKSYLKEKGYSSLEIESVLALHPKPLEYISRLEATRAFLALPEAAGLAEADKRIRNILIKSGGASVVKTTDESRLQLDAEKQLFRITRLLRSQVDELLKKEKFKDALLLTAQIHQPVTAFFEKVMVNVEDKAVQFNRFALLHEVGNLTNLVANISKLAA